MGTRQLAMATTALGLWLKRACFPLQLDHVIDELDRHTEMRRRGAVRVTFFYEIDHTCPKFHWMGFAHVCLPMMLTNTESQIKQIGNPESHQREHALMEKPPFSPARPKVWDWPWQLAWQSMGQP